MKSITFNQQFFLDNAPNLSIEAALLFDYCQTLPVDTDGDIYLTYKKVQVDLVFIFKGFKRRAFFNKVSSLVEVGLLFNSYVKPKGNGFYVVSASKDTVSASKDTVSASKDTVSASKDTVSASKDTVSASKDTVSKDTLTHCTKPFDSLFGTPIEIETEKSKKVEAYTTDELIKRASDFIRNKK